MLQIVQPSQPKNLAALDNVFSDDDEGPIISNTKKKKVIKSLGEITDNIKTLCQSLKNIKKQPEFGDVTLIPEKELTLELKKFMNAFEKSRDLSLFTSLNISKYSKNIQLQINLLRSTIDENVIFSDIPDDIDPRISALLHWQISRYESKGVKCYYLLHSLLNIVKTEMPAPISVFFLEFNVENLIFQFCQSIVSLFAESPFLAPVLESLSAFSNDPSTITSMNFDLEDNNNNNKNNNNLDDFGMDDDDSDDDEFGDLKPMAQASAPPLIKVKEISIENPFDNLDKEKEEPIKLPESPSPVTFRFFKNKAKATSEEFTRWMTKHQCSSTKVIFTYNEKIDVNCSTKLTEDVLVEITNKMFDTDVRHMMPKRPYPRLLPLIFPILHQINSTSSELYSNGCDLKAVIENEYNAHIGFATKNQKMIDNTINLLLPEIKAKCKPVEIKSMKERRPYPPKETDIDSDFIFLLKLIDYSLIIESYSPISLLPSSSLPPQLLTLSKRYLAESIFGLYIKKAYPPYISFRAAFTIGLLISDQNPSLAVDFIYEGIFLVMHFYPQLNYATYVQAAFFAMGELFNNTNRYYFCAMSMDNASHLCEKNHSLSAKAASIAMKNMDAVRAVFHYLSAIKLFIASKQKEEFLYTAQMVVSIYVEHDLTTEAIQLISYILKVHDKLDSINSVNAASTLCRLYCSKGHFEDSKKLANSIDVSNPALQRIATSLKSQIFLSQNMFKEFYASVKPVLTFTNNALPPQLITKEIVLPALKSLAHAFASKEDFLCSLFWCEIGCHISSQISAVKETPKFFLLRGNILYFIYYSMFDNSVHLLNSSLDNFAKTFGMFLVESELSKLKVLREALSSLTVSINYFERSGNVAKLLESRIVYLQLVCSYLVAKQDSDTFIVTKPKMFTSCTVAKINSKNLDLEEIEIKGADQFMSICRSLQNLVNSFYDPLAVSRVQTITSIFFLLKEDFSSAELVFDQAVKNVREFFFKGTKFIISNCKIWFTLKLQFFLRFLLSSLMDFPGDYINQRLYLFDMMNDVSLLLNYQKNTTVTQTKSTIEPKIEFTSSICVALDDSNWPKFNVISLHNERKRISVSQKIFALYTRMHKNETSLSDEKISVTNKRIACRILKLKMKQVVPKFKLPDNSIYVYLSNGEIGVYIPSLQSRRFIPLNALRKTTFVEGVTNMIDFNLDFHPFPEDFMKSCLMIGRALFGSLDFFKKFTIPEEADTHDLGIKCNYERGRLYSLNPPESALIVICDHLLHFLPFEFFFPSISLIRRFNSDHRENHRASSRPIIFRNKYDQNFVEYRRTKLLEALQSELPRPLTVVGNEGMAVFPFPLFNPNKPSHTYIELYTFFDVIPIQADNLPNLSEMKNALFILTFSDLIAVPDFLYQLIDTNPKACFLFIPANHVSLALLEIRKILERHQLRKDFIEKNGKDPKFKQFSLLFKDKFAFMTTMQMTLMKKFRIPVAIICPNRSVF